MYYSGEEEGKLVEGRDISVCVRVRPLLDYKQEAGYFGTVLARNPRVTSLEPRLDFCGGTKTRQE